jgi:hypothetical protein
MAKRTVKGLGDTIENVLQSTGIDKVAKFILGEDCGCDKRKEKLNELFPYKYKPLCLNEDEYDWLSKGGLKKAETSIVDSMIMQRTHNRIFQTGNLEYTACDSCLRDQYNQLKKVYDTYHTENNN